MSSLGLYTVLALVVRHMCLFDEDGHEQGESTEVATRPPDKSMVPTARDQPSRREIRTSKSIANQSMLQQKDS